MDPITILSFISLAIKAAPEAEQVFVDGKNLVESLFSAGVITKAQQQAYMDWANAHMAATLFGKEPPEFVVDSAPPVPAAIEPTEAERQSVAFASIGVVVKPSQLAVPQTAPAVDDAPEPTSKAPASAPVYAGSVSDHLASLAQ